MSDDILKFASYAQRARESLHREGIHCGPAVRIDLAENPRPAVTRDEARVTFFEAVDKLVATGLPYRRALAETKAKRPEEYRLLFGGG